MKKEPRSDLKQMLDLPEVVSWRMLLKAFRLAYQELQTRCLSQHGCTLPRFQILFYLYFQGPLPAIRLAELLVVTRGNISTFIRRLLADSLIQVATESPSRSRPFYELSEEGRRSFEEIFPSHIKNVQALIPSLTVNCLREMEQIVQRADPRMKVKEASMLP